MDLSSVLIRLELLVFSNTPALGDLTRTTDTHCAVYSDPTSKKKRIAVGTGKRERDDHYVVTNLNSMLAGLADGMYLLLIHHQRQRLTLNRE